MVPYNEVSIFYNGNDYNGIIVRVIEEGFLVAF
jgi:hypothetical protein